MAQNLPDLEKVEIPDDFRRIAERVKNLVSALKGLDYDLLHKELRDLNIPSSSNPTLQKINEEIQRIQVARDRVSEIYMDASRNYLIRKRACDLLTEGWYRFSAQASSDKRKAEALLIMSQYIESSIESESLFKAAQQVMKNLDDKHESASRQVTVFQLLLKMRDFGRGTPDSFHFGEPYDKDEEGDDEKETQKENNLEGW